MQTNDIVSKYFIGQYYQTLCQDFKNMHKFYASDCTLSISVDKNSTKSVSGSDKIVALFEECGLQESVVNLDNGHMNYVATENGGMIILVSGQMSLADQKERQFAQAFMLVKIGECYAIKCDMLQLMEAPEIYIEQEIEEVVEEEAPKEEPVSPVEKYIPSFPQPEENKVEEEVKVEEAPKVEEEAPKVEEEVKVEEEAPKVEEEAPKVEEEVKVEEAPVEKVEEVKVEEAPKEEVKEEVKVEAPVEEVKEEVKEEAPKEEAPVPTEQPKEEVAEKTIVEAEKPAAPTEQPQQKPQQPAMKKIRPQNRRYGYRNNMTRPTHKEEHKEDDFVVVKSNYTKKATTKGSSIFVKYNNKSINREALLNLFKNEGTVVDTYVNDYKLFGFIDFSEKDAAAKVVAKAKEEPFRIGNVTLNVQINHGRNDFVNRTRPSPKKE